MLLEHIGGPEDLKVLTYHQLDTLAQEIREFIIEKTSHTGGHLASNLGVVELTIALFRALDLPEDKIIWDVGHQAYTHKILSGSGPFLHFHLRRPWHRPGKGYPWGGLYRCIRYRRRGPYGGHGLRGPEQRGTS